MKTTDATVKNLTDGQLDELVYNKAADLYFESFGESFKDTEKDNLLRRMFAVTVLDNEVKNGGFDSFFHNSADLDDAALNGLKDIGAYHHANLCRQAISIYREQNLEFRNKRNPHFDALDEAYYTLQDVRTKRQKFVRENIDKFVD